MTAKAPYTSTCTSARHRISRFQDSSGKCCPGCASRARNSKEPTCGSRLRNWSIPPWAAKSTVSGEGEEDTTMGRYLCMYVALAVAAPGLFGQAKPQDPSPAAAAPQQQVPVQPRLRRGLESYAER